MSLRPLFPLAAGFVDGIARGLRTIGAPTICAALAFAALSLSCAPLTPAQAANVAAGADDAQIALVTADGIAQLACLAIKDPRDSARCAAIAAEVAKILEANAEAVKVRAMAQATGTPPKPSAKGPDERGMPDP